VPPSGGFLFQGRRKENVVAFIKTLYNLWSNRDEKIPGLRAELKARSPASSCRPANIIQVLHHIMPGAAFAADLRHDVRNEQGELMPYFEKWLGGCPRFVRRA
jgi:hypothetical protein